MKYIALIRGVNVGGKRIKMAHLKENFESMGYKNVKTYLQSGNVIFEDKSSNITEIRQNIENNINKEFEFSVNVIIRTEKELEYIIINNPFNKENMEISSLYVTFLQNVPDEEILANLDLNIEDNERFEIIGKEIYLYLPHGYARTKLTNNALEKKLKIVATTRNWKTTNKLMELSKLD